MKDPIDDFTPLTFSKAVKIKLLIDICVQALGFLLTFFFLAIEDYVTAAKVFYMGVGGYQLTSSLVHLFFGRPLASYEIYYIQLGIYAALFAIMFMGSYLVGFFLFFATPCTAIYYLVITIQTYGIARKPS